MSEFLIARIPLSKICGLLESGRYLLTHSTHLRQLIPFILDEELSNLRKLVSGKPISIIFDGTTHIAEAFVVVLPINGLFLKRLHNYCFYAYSLCTVQPNFYPSRACAARVNAIGSVSVCLYVYKKIF